MSSVNKKDIQPYWRPDFRNPATLPDIKVVRTDFIVNFVALIVALGVIVYIMQHEYRIWSLGSSLDEMKQRIRIAEPDDNIYLKQSESFRSAGRYIRDLEKFYTAPFYPHELLVELSDLNSDDILLKDVNFAESVVEEGKKKSMGYRVNLNGEVRSLPTLDDYVVSLRNLEIFDIEGYELKVEEEPRRLNDVTGLYPYSVSIWLNPSQGAKKKGGK